MSSSLFEEKFESKSQENLTNGEDTELTPAKQALLSFIFPFLVSFPFPAPHPIPFLYDLAEDGS